MYAINLNREIPICGEVVNPFMEGNQTSLNCHNFLLQQDRHHTFQLKLHLIVVPSKHLYICDVINILL